MSNRVGQIKPRELIKALQKAGFVVRRQTGSHARLVHPDGRKTSIAIHRRPLAKGTLAAILRQMKISREELKRLL